MFEQVHVIEKNYRVGLKDIIKREAIIIQIIIVLISDKCTLWENVCDVNPFVLVA